MGCHKSNDPGEVLNYLFNFSYLQGLGNWDIFSLDINHAYWEPGVVFTTNACFPPGIPWVLNIEEECLVL
jgi:hypothetical protein